MNLQDYMDLFPAYSREKPRLMAMAESLLRQAADLEELVVSMPSAFAFAEAEGVQLDAIAETIGLRRAPGMTDEDFRAYLLAKLKLWTWDGTNAGTAVVLPACVAQTDNGDGTVSVCPAGTGKDLLPVPAGVRVESDNG